MSSSTKSQTPIVTAGRAARAVVDDGSSPPPPPPPQPASARQTAVSALHRSPGLKATEILPCRTNPELRKDPPRRTSYQLGGKTSCDERSHRTPARPS